MEGAPSWGSYVVADDQWKKKVTLIKNDLILIKYEAEKLGLELVASLVRMAILEVEGKLKLGGEPA